MLLPMVCMQMYTDNSIPELSDAAHSCSRDDLATAWLMSEQPGNVTPVTKTYSQLRARVHRFSQ